MLDAAQVTLGVAAVARRLGVATGTLRTWDRRYGVGPSGHETGSRRRYTPTDLARLTLMRQLMVQGVSAADAARTATTAPDTALPSGADPVVTVPSSGRPGRPGGGRVVATHGAGPAARGLARAAMGLDSDACVRLVRASLAASGALVTWTDVLVPVLAGVDDRVRSSGAGLEIEHLLSESAEVALCSAPTPPGALLNARPVLLAALEPEVHRLPLAVLGAALAERRVATRPLGARLPARALADAVVRTGALAVVLWAYGEGGPARWSEDSALNAVRPRPALVLAGPGWEGEADRPRVWLAADPAAAVSAVVALVAGGGRPG